MIAVHLHLTDREWHVEAAAKHLACLGPGFGTRHETMAHVGRAQLETEGLAQAPEHVEKDR